MWLSKKNPKKIKLAEEKQPTYIPEAIGVALSAICLFILLACISYNPFDNSLFYYSSTNGVPTNWCGVIGAHIAALLFYVWGTAAYVFLTVVVAGVYVACFHRSSLKNEPFLLGPKSRLVAGVLLTFATAVLCRIYAFDITKSVAGGSIGYHLQRLLFSLFNEVGTQVFVWAVFIISLVWATRISLVFVATTLWPYTMWIAQTMWQGLKVGFSYMAMLSSLIFNRKREKTIEEVLEIQPSQQANTLPSEELRSYPSTALRTNEASLDTICDANHSRRTDLIEDQKNQINLDEPIINVRPSRVSDEAGSEGGFIEGFGHQNPYLSYHHVHPKAHEHSILKKQTISVIRNSVLAINSLALMQKLLIPPSQQQSIKNESIPLEVSSIEPEKQSSSPIQSSAVAYKLPDMSLFLSGQGKQIDEKAMQEEYRERGKKLEEKLERFGVKGRIKAIRPGPVITVFEYEPEIDSKISKIVALEDDLALALTALSMRIVAPIPGKNVIGFEIANQLRHNVSVDEIIQHQAFKSFQGALPIILGVDSAGQPIVQDLTQAPHLLVAGSTGSGKSVGMNLMLFTLLCKLKPDELKLILVDPKRLEFAPYSDIPHLLFPIITNPRQAAPALAWVAQEMENRYEIMASAGVRSIKEYQEAYKAGTLPKDKELPPLPFLVVMIDELADLMMVAGKEVEIHIARIAQMARAAGIHLILATQRPSVDVLTGVIKVNFPSRIAYRVSSKIDSRTILDMQGGEKLLGKGDMLYLHGGSSDPIRVHGAYVSDKQISKLADYVRSLDKPQYLDLHAVTKQQQAAESDEHDELYDQVCELIKTRDEISISMIQRHFRIGFNRSARLIEKLELDGLIAPAQGSKPRKVLR